MNSTNIKFYTDPISKRVLGIRRKSTGVTSPRHLKKVKPYGTLLLFDEHKKDADRSRSETIEEYLKLNYDFTASESPLSSKEAFEKVVRCADKHNHYLLPVTYSEDDHYSTILSAGRLVGIIYTDDVSRTSAGAISVVDRREKESMLTHEVTKFDYWCHGNSYEYFLYMEDDKEPAGKSFLFLPTDFKTEDLSQEVYGDWVSLGEYRSAPVFFKKNQNKIELLHLRCIYSMGMYVVNTAESMRHADFWSCDQNASLRARYDKEHSAGPVNWTEGGHQYSAQFRTSASRRNVYTYRYYYKDGQKTTLTAIKKSLERMAHQIEKLEADVNIADSKKKKKNSNIP